eukprot:TRINITY_DN7331_c0_g1_i1.p1 TRINITY_DN7331_c0_g1~~TRINITY_DN7331_c0_g1_i1.p1  ORF type:complete len:399 (+),score=84.56 TRINITY_DN7331_c0_g1_i1:47-1198(+)
MTTVALPPIVNNENVAPNVNVPTVTPVKVAKPELAVPAPPVVSPIVPPPVEVQPEDPVPAEEEEMEDNEELDDTEFSDDSEEESEDEDEDIDSELDETYGEQSLEGFPGTRLEEAREAEEMAKEVGLGSTNEALTHVGQTSVKRVSLTVERYHEIMGQDNAAKNLYDGLTVEINALRAMINGGVHKVVSDMNVTASPFAVDEARSILESYLRLVVERSVVHCEYRDQEVLGINDVLITLNLLGRPLYWSEHGSSLSHLLDASEQDDGENDEYVPMDDHDEEEEDEDEESSDEEEEMVTWEGKDGCDDDVYYFDRPSFRRLVDVINKSPVVSIHEQAYLAMQSSAEDYLTQLFAAAYKVTCFAGRSQIEQADVRFARDLSQVRF